MTIRRKFFLFSLCLNFMTMALSAQAASDDGKDFQVGYKKGFYFKSPDERYSLNINGRIQLQYLFDHLENLTGAANFNGVTNTFMLRRLYVYFSGHFFDPNLSYLIQLTPAGGTPVEDVTLAYTFNPAFTVKGGAFKLPMNRQEFTSSGKQQLVERSLADNRFNIGQSLGANVYGTLFDKQFEYYLFLANGRNTGITANDINEFLGGARFVFNPLGEYGYSESDVEFSTDPALTFGVGGAIYKENLQRTTGQDRVVVGSADVGFKYLGFSFQGEFFARDSNPNASTAVGNPDTIQTGTGYYAQAGYFLVPRHFELAARGSSVFYDQDANDHEFTGGMNYFFSGHALKLQFDYSYLLNGQVTGNVAYQTEHRLRLQSTLTF